MSKMKNSLEIVEVVVASIATFDLVSYMFLTYFPVLSATLNLLHMSGEDVIGWIIFIYVLFITFFLLRRYFKVEGFID